VSAAEKTKDLPSEREGGNNVLIYRMDDQVFRMSGGIKILLKSPADKCF